MILILVDQVGERFIWIFICQLTSFTAQKGEARQHNDKPKSSSPCPLFCFHNKRISKVCVLIFLSRDGDDKSFLLELFGYPTAYLLGTKRTHSSHEELFNYFISHSPNDKEKWLWEEKKKNHSNSRKSWYIASCVLIGVPLVIYDLHKHYVGHKVLLSRSLQGTEKQLKCVW